MPITELERENRKKFLGSSDAAAVLGLDPYRSPLDIFYDKTGQIIPTGNDLVNDAIDVGNWCEEAVLKWFCAKKNLTPILNDEKNGNRRVHKNGVMAANFDCLVLGDDTQAIEAKTHGVISGWIDESWGEVETDQVPERVALQCQHQMAVLPKVQTVWVPVLLGGIGFRHYRIDRNQELISNLENIEMDFWNDHVLKGVPPEGEPASLETFKKLKREPNKVIDISKEIVASWLAAKEECSKAEAIKEEKTALLLSALGNAEGARCDLGELTYFLNKGRKEYLVSAKEPFRQLMFKKPKGK